MRFNSNGIDIRELWAGLAQIMVITTPGTSLLFLSLSYRRWPWKTVFQGDDGPVVHGLSTNLARGQGLALFQVLAIVLITNGTNFAFALEACGFAGFKHYHSAPTDLDHLIWLGWPTTAIRYQGCNCESTASLAAALLTC